MPAAARILLIDDDPGDRELVITACESAARGTEIITADSAERALVALEGDVLPSLILVDLSMPGLSGYALLRKLRANHRTCAIPAIVLSGSADPAAVRQAYHSGATAFLVKPADFEGMLDLCESLRSFWLDHVLLTDAA